MTRPIDPVLEQLRIEHEKYLDENTHMGYKLRELSNAFDRVKDGLHWKNPIDTIVFATEAEVRMIDIAITFYTGSTARITQLGTAEDDGHASYRICAAGYYLTIGA